MKPYRIILVAALVASPWALAGTPIDQSRPLAADGRVRIENVKGSVQVRTWDRPQVHVGGSLGEGVKQLLVEGSDRSVRIKVEYPQGAGWFGGNHAEPSDLIIDMPVGADLDVDVVSADVDVAGVSGRHLSIDSVSGRVSALGKPAQADLESVSGDVVATLESSDLKVSSVSGGLRVSTPVGGEIELETVSGDIHVEAGTVKRLGLESVSGSADAQLQGLTAGGRIKGETLSGRLSLSLPATTSAALNISTFSGAIRSAVGEVKRERYGPGASLEARLGEGDGKIELESFSGEVRFDLR